MRFLPIYILNAGLIVICSKTNWVKLGHGYRKLDKTTNLEKARIYTIMKIKEAMLDK